MVEVGVHEAKALVTADPQIERYDVSVCCWPTGGRRLETCSGSSKEPSLLTIDQNGDDKQQRAGVLGVRLDAVEHRHALVDQDL